MTTAHLIGAAAGALVGFAGFVVLRLVADRVERTAGSPSARDSARVLRIAATVDLLVMTLIGYIVGPLVVG